MGMMEKGAKMAQFGAAGDSEIAVSQYDNIITNDDSTSCHGNGEHSGQYDRLIC